MCTFCYRVRVKFVIRSVPRHLQCTCLLMLSSSTIINLPDTDMAVSFCSFSSYISHQAFFHLHRPSHHHSVLFRHLHHFYLQRRPSHFHHFRVQLRLMYLHCDRLRHHHHFSYYLSRFRPVQLHHDFHSGPSHVPSGCSLWLCH